MTENDFFKSLSVFFAVCDVISAALIADFTLKNKKVFNLGWAARLCLAFLAVGLLLHSAEQVQILQNYRAPRSISWIWIYLALHSLIAAVWWRARRRGI